MSKHGEPGRSFRLLCIIAITAAGALGAAGGAAAAPQELKMVEHATTDAVTDTGAAGDSACGHILTFANEVYDADDKAKIGTDQGICAPAPWSARRGSASGRSPWIRGN